MGQPMNYDRFASTYGYTRWALPRILSPLSSAVSTLPQGSIIIDVGCGTGDYIAALSGKYDGHRFLGFDLSEEMLEIAKARCDRAEFRSGNADEEFPYPDSLADMLFCVDVVHHLTKLVTFFRESYRVLKSPGVLVIVTYSEDDIRGRSLSRYFPEVLNLEFGRYPRIAEVLQEARGAGFREQTREVASGYIEIDKEFIGKLERKCSSALRLISEDAHQRGMESIRQAGSRGEEWLSRYTVLRFDR